LASAVAYTSFLARQPLHAFIVRKEPKGHGTGQWVEGLSSFKSGATVAIVEDVVTTGASTLKAIQRAVSEGLKVTHAFAIVDRLEGGREPIEAEGYQLVSLYTRKDFLP
jgi:orotate phosphoribosyltransferase